MDKQPTNEQIQKLDEIKQIILASAYLCPVCKSEINQTVSYEKYGSRYHLSDCICVGCGIRIARYKYPVKFIDNYAYAVVSLDSKIYAIDPVGRTYLLTKETRTAHYTSDTGHDYESDYTVDILTWFGLIEDLWSSGLW
jgi:hypothetical protein